MNFFYNKGCGVCFEVATKNTRQQKISLVAILDKNQYATVLNLDKAKERWECGHYFSDFEAAYDDYLERT
ncbi:MAG: hypothetical protein J1G02_06265 [Clostridiales bacterium]|nr:hypothetical protein [Clostridiales bacterium]